MTIGVNSIVVYLSPDNLTKDSDIVLTGSVKEILPKVEQTGELEEMLKLLNVSS